MNLYKPIILLLAYLIMPVLAVEIGSSVEMSREFTTGDQFMGIRLLGTLDLSGLPVKGLAAHELSGLAWDEDDQILYALSDKGYLLHLRPVFNNTNLQNVDLIDAYYLKNKKGKKLTGLDADAEGLAILNGNNGIEGDAELIISFEIKPRIHRFTPQGELIRQYKLPEAIDSVEKYDYKNAALESVIIHPELGMLTAPQMPLRKSDKHLRSIHNLKGKTWQFEPQHEDDSSITDLEMTADGSILILERRYSTILAPIQSIIRRIRLDKNDQNNTVLPTETVALFDSTNGWKIDNFEGLARHKENKYFMVSDDNNNLFQRTLLVYFELTGFSEKTE